jgi:hypothetical protein
MIDQYKDVFQRYHFVDLIFLIQNMYDIVDFNRFNRILLGLNVSNEPFDHPKSRLGP